MDEEWSCEERDLRDFAYDWDCTILQQRNGEPITGGIIDVSDLLSLRTNVVDALSDGILIAEIPSMARYRR